MEDVVNHPSHYEAESVQITLQPIDLCEQCGFLMGNALKYMFRYQHKGKPIEDLKKARFYLKRYQTALTKPGLNTVCLSGVDLDSLQFKAYENAKPFLSILGHEGLRREAVEKLIEWVENAISEELMK